MEDEQSSTTDSERVDRKQRFDYILNFWKSRESFCPIRFIEFFTGADRNSNKQHVEKPSLPPPSPSPQWFDTQNFTKTCASVDDLLDARDLDRESDFTTVLGSVSTGFYPCPTSREGNVPRKEDLPWPLRWRFAFLLVALLCLSYVLVSATMTYFWPRLPSAQTPPSPPPSPLPARNPPFDSQDGDHCDWDCLNFLFN